MADLEQNGGLGDVFQTSTQWTDQLSDRRRKKRKTQTSKGSSSDNYIKMDIDEFKTLSTDEKLSALFTKFNFNNKTLTELDAKMDKCLQISSDVKTNKNVSTIMRQVYCFWNINLLTLKPAVDVKISCLSDLQKKRMKTVSCR